MALRKKNNELRDQAISWIWVALFISAVLYLQGLLGDLRIETTRLADERLSFQKEMHEERAESEELFEEFYAEINRTVGAAIKAIGVGEMTCDYFDF